MENNHVPQVSRFCLYGRKALCIHKGPSCFLCRKRIWYDITEQKVFKQLLHKREQYLALPKEQRDEIDRIEKEKAGRSKE